ncbi:MAG: molybdopterin-dependent oxidoreductase [Candidatus Tectomicrobia bacterium]|uniref:Molybdopterin-dependent oxidoreductase n=1 Tax=Tectimicrobiota bacterium TaxID=2528274 RepID=A0A932GSS5_UNCTE|nr:molybdopterin-dependent oxidoreductase [Candidatus Tectomicrobia bacterium]
MAETFSIIGKPLPPHDGADRVCGRAEYTADVKLPGLLYAKILRSPYPHARVTKLDTRKAAALPGVKAVLTFRDVAAVPAGPALGKQKSVLGETVRFVGDGVAAVAAVRESIAEDALRLIEVEYERLPFVLDPEEALKPEAPKIYPEGNLLGGKPLVFNRGDVEKGFAEADRIFEETYTTPIGVGNAMEPRATLARWERGKLTVWLSSQAPFGARAYLASALKMPENRVRVISTYVGGGWGTKAGPHGDEAVCALLAKKAGAPVLLNFTREEEMLCAHIRYAMKMTFKAGIKRDGTLTTLSVKMIGNQGAYASAFGDLGTQATHLYQIPNLRTERYRVHTNTPSAGPVRGVGDPYETFALEQLVDMMAHELGLDPLQVHLKNIVRTGTDIDGSKVSSSGLEECIRKGAEKIRWESRGKPGAAAGSKKRGLGMALTDRTGGVGPSSAVVKINFDGSVNLLMGATDIGTGSRTSICQVVAEVLGVDLKDITVTSSDTEMVPFCPGTFGSRVMHTAGKAAYEAALEARKKLFAAAASQLKARLEELEIRDHVISVLGAPDRKIPLKEVTQKAGVMFIGSASTMQPVRPQTARQYGAQFAEVEVDTETGQVAVLRVVAAHDVGRAINPQIIDNQIEGGVIQGIGMAFSERLLFDRATGIPLNADLLDFKVPTMMELTVIEPILVEANNPLGPFGAKGVGEGPVQIPMAAIANAFFNATGRRIKELPMTRGIVLAAL